MTAKECNEKSEECWRRAKRAAARNDSVMAWMWASEARMWIERAKDTTLK